MLSDAAEVCKEAVTRTLDLKQPEKSVIIRISTIGVFIVDAGNGDVMKEAMRVDASMLV